MSGVWRLILRRLIAIPISLLIVATVAFWLVHLFPGNPAREIAGQYAAPQVLAAITDKLGLEHGFWRQYVSFVNQLAHGNLGDSYFGGGTVASEIFSRFGSDVELIVASLLLATLWGLLLATVSAFARRRPQSGIANGLMSVQQSIPDFVAGLVLIYLLSFRLNLLPSASGQLSIIAITPPHVTGSIVVDAALAGQWGTFWDAIDHLVLPAVSLGIVLSAIVARVGRTALIESLRGAHVEYARSLGLRRRSVLVHVISTARTPILTTIATLLGGLVGGSAIVETIFSWNGAAQWALSAIEQLDLPSIEGVVVVFGGFTIGIYLLLDIVILLGDPRARIG